MRLRVVFHGPRVPCPCICVTPRKAYTPVHNAHLKELDKIVRRSLYHRLIVLRIEQTDGRLDITDRPGFLVLVFVLAEVELLPHVGIVRTDRVTAEQVPSVMEERIGTGPHTIMGPPPHAIAGGSEIHCKTLLKAAGQRRSTACTPLLCPTLRATSRRAHWQIKARGIIISVTKPRKHALKIIVI